MDDGGINLIKVVRVAGRCGASDGHKAVAGWEFDRSLEIVSTARTRYLGTLPCSTDNSPHLTLP